MKGSPLLLLTLIVCSTALAAIYTWVDEQGKTHYSDSPPARQQAQQITVQPTPQAAPTATPGLRPGERQLLEDMSQQTQQRAQQEAEQQLGQETRPRQVLGSMVLDFHILAGAELPSSAMNLTLVITPLPGDSRIRYTINNEQWAWSEWRNKSVPQARALATLNFSTSLAPGVYQLDDIEVVAAELSQHPFQLPVGAVFTVPDDHDCVYIGRSFFNYVRLPPGSRTQQKMAAAEAGIHLNSTLDHLYFKQGGLVLLSRDIDIAPRENGPRSLIKKSREPYLQARKMGCVMQAARF